VVPGDPAVAVAPVAVQAAPVAVAAVRAAVGALEVAAGAVVAPAGVGVATAVVVTSVVVVDAPAAAVLDETADRPAAAEGPAVAVPAVRVRVAARPRASRRDGRRGVRPGSNARVIGLATSTVAVRRPPMLACRTAGCPTGGCRTVEGPTGGRPTARIAPRRRPVCRSVPTNRDCPPTSTRGGCREESRQSYVVCRRTWLKSSPDTSSQQAC
jgi:hypothetical protein